jgi:hypothetical protein
MMRILVPEAKWFFGVCRARPSAAKSRVRNWNGEIRVQRSRQRNEKGGKDCSPHNTTTTFASTYKDNFAGRAIVPAIRMQY